MAKLSDLIPRTAAVLGLPESSVALYGRYLREARMISTGGRGPGGAEMTPQDCANLLMALMIAEHAKDASFAVRLGAYLIVEKPIWVETYSAKNPHWHPLPKELCFLASPLTFYTHLVHLIKMAQSGELQSVIGKIIRPQLRIEFGRPVPFAQISLGGEDENGKGIGYFHSHALVANDAPKDVLDFVGIHHENSDLRTISTVSQKTIFAFGELLRD